MLTSSTINTIKATVPALRAHARDITEHFYPLMFSRYPAVQAYFNQTHQAAGTQRQALANAVIAYAANIENLQVLGDAVNLIAHKHCSLNILPEHYPIVGECLLDAIAFVLGDAASEEILDAWGQAYQQLANLLIGVEEEIYQAHSERSGGWRGEREFTVVKKVAESDVITSFYLQPAEGGGAAIDFLPGQYVGLVMNIDGSTVRRNYSLSQAPGQATLRISVKREPDGLVSTYLHNRCKPGDTLMVNAPCGEFVLANNHHPVCFITGGVGITPALSMLEVAVKQDRDIVFVHAAQNSQTHGFKARVDALAAEYPRLKVFYIYDQPLAGDQPHAVGLLEQKHLAALLPAPSATDVYFLGPKPFMRNVFAMVNALGVPASNIRYEFFGPLAALVE